MSRKNKEKETSAHQKNQPTKLGRGKVRVATLRKLENVELHCWLINMVMHVASQCRALTLPSATARLDGQMNHSTRTFIQIEKTLFTSLCAPILPIPLLLIRLGYFRVCLFTLELRIYTGA